LKHKLNAVSTSTARLSKDTVIEIRKPQSVSPDIMVNRHIRPTVLYLVLPLRIGNVHTSSIWN